MASARHAILVLAAQPRAASSSRGAEKAAVFMGFFEGGSGLWEAVGDAIAKEVPQPAKILDIGSGPGEPACYLASRFGGAVTSTDIAAPMVENAKKRVGAKGLSNVECQVLDVSDMQASVPDASVDVVSGEMVYQFVPQKAVALKETFRVLKPGGLLVANVWESLSQLPICGKTMAAVTGNPPAPPPFNPNGPLGLKDADETDQLLTAAGFELATGHNARATCSFPVGPAGSEQAFKAMMLPIWDKLGEMEASGQVPDAWARALAAFPDAAAPSVVDGQVVFAGDYRMLVAKKPP